MTTAINSIHPQTNHWPATINWGDIVAFDLPSRRHDIGQQALYDHPWLVVDVNDFVGMRYMTLAQGKIIDQLPHRSHKILVARSEALKSAGLKRPRIFNCRGLVIVSVMHEGFIPNSNGTPIIGKLIGEERHHLNSVRARRQAFTDMKAKRHSDRKQKRQSANHTDVSVGSGPAVLEPLSFDRSLGR